MHETVLAKNILKILSGTIPIETQNLVRTVHVRAGSLLAIVPELLDESFRIEADNTPFNHSRIKLTANALSVLCHACGQTAELPKKNPGFKNLTCPLCKSPDVTIEPDHELLITHVEVEE